MSARTPALTTGRALPLHARPQGRALPQGTGELHGLAARRRIRRLRQALRACQRAIADSSLLHGPPRVAEVACWAHVRRGFHDDYASRKSAIAKEALDRIGALFDIERTIAGQPPDIRRSVRKRTARPRIDELAEWFDAQLLKLPGKGDLAAAIRYARSRWQALTR